MLGANLGLHLYGDVSVMDGKFSISTQRRNNIHVSRGNIKIEYENNSALIQCTFLQFHVSMHLLSDMRNSDSYIHSTCLLKLDKED